MELVGCEDVEARSPTSFSSWVVHNLQYDDEYLSCDIKLFNNNIKKRFAQKVDNLQTIVLNNISKGEC